MRVFLIEIIYYNFDVIYLLCSTVSILMGACEIK